MTYCKGCLSKQQKINELEEEITSLKSKLRYQERTAKEGSFGSSTPSSKLPVKANSSKEQQRNRGGWRCKYAAPKTYLSHDTASVNSFLFTFSIHLQYLITQSLSADPYPSDVDYCPIANEDVYVFSWTPSACNWGH